MPQRPPVVHRVRFPDPRNHLVEVETRVPTAGRRRLRVGMPVWTPGSYLVREYARHVEGFAARAPQGEPRPARKVRKNRWEVETGGEPEVTLLYRVYARELSVRSNFVDERFALLNGAATFVAPLEDGPAGEEIPSGRGPPHELNVERPEGWEQVLCALPPPAGASEGEGRFWAADFDALVDSPIVAGNPTVYRFEAGGKPHVLVNIEEGGVWDGPLSAVAVERIVRAHHEFWGTVPYDRYVFFNLLTEVGGGLEHRDSSVLMTSRWSTRRRADWLRWMGLVSHELFHAWNIKRLRPVDLGPFDYENEVYTRSLWVAEGITTYYTFLLVRRAGLASESEFLDKLGELVSRLRGTPGRELHSLEQASFDAWIKLYRPDENTVNTTVNYYVKGAVVAFLLDARIRQATNDRRSLDDLLRLAFDRWSGERGFDEVAFREAASEVAGTDLRAWLDDLLATPGEVDLEPALGRLGLRLEAKTNGYAAEGTSREDDSPGGSPRPWVGVGTRVDDGRLIVLQVLRDSPASRAGVQAGDEILGIDDWRVPATRWPEHLEVYRPGDEVELLVARRERFERVPLTLAERPPESWRVVPDPEATKEQQARRASWLQDGGSGAA